MSEAEKLRALADGWLRRGGEALEAGKVLLNAGYRSDSVNRSYYAMFYGAQALLCVRGLSSSKHKGVLSQFSKEFVRNGPLPKETSAWIHEAFNARLGADYDVEEVLSVEEAQAHMENAERFLNRAREALPVLLSEVTTDTDTSC